MNRQAFAEQLHTITVAIEQLGGEVDFDTFAPPATAQQIAEVEQQLHMRLPAHFKNALLHISSHVLFFWQLPDDVVFETPHEEVFSGHIEWDLHALVSMKARYDEIVTSIFSEETDAYDAIWQNKLPFLPIGNGDYLAFHLQEDEAPIVYLSHDGSENHGKCIAKNFEQLLHIWGAVGFVGAEDWQWEQLTTSYESGIVLTFAHTKTLQKLLRLQH